MEISIRSPLISEVEPANERASKHAGHFTFHALDNNFVGLEAKENRQLLDKWNVTPTLSVKRFRYDEYFDEKKQTDDFLTDFFNSDAFKQEFKIYGSQGEPVSLGSVQKVDFKRVPCSSTSTEVFDKFQELGIVTSAGTIRKCVEDRVDDVVVADELRRALLVEDSDHYLEFSDDERDEFIFQLFKHAVVGGSLCQYEDDVAPYIDVVKAIYKDLVTVRKNPQTNKIEVESSVFRIFNTASDRDLFPKSNTNNVFFVVASPINRHVKCYYFAYLPYW